MNEVMHRLSIRSKRALVCASAFLLLLVMYGQVVTASAEDAIVTRTGNAAFHGKATAAPEFAEAHVNPDEVPESHVNQDDGEGEEPPEATRGRRPDRLLPNPDDVWIDPVQCPGDVDGDGEIAFEDMVAVLSSWGVCDACPADVDQDGNVNLEDLSVILGGWGTCNP